MRRRRDLAVIGDLAHFPQPLDVGARPGHGAYLVLARRVVEHQDILGDRGARHRVLGRRHGKCRLQGADRREVEIGVAPLDDLDRFEGVRLQRLRKLGLEWRTASRGAEGAVAGGAPGPPRDLGEFGGTQFAELITVELSVGGERDVIDVEIEAHADGVGRHQIVDVAGLVERHLRIARARRQRAEHHGGAAALAANQLRNRVHLLGRECDDGRAPRQPRELFFAGEAQLRQPRAAHNADAGEQPFDDRPHRGGAEDQCLLAAAPVQDAIGEDVAALEVRGQLDFVDGEERHIEVARHGFDGGDPEARIGRLDLLLAGDERDCVRPHPFYRAVVNLAGKQPQRQADQPGRMRQHPFDGEMGFAGIGRPQHGGDAGAAGAQITVGGGRKGNRHRRLGLPRQRSGCICITTTRGKALCLRCGTSLEQIAAESATRAVFEFVHGDIWRRRRYAIPHRVFERSRGAHFSSERINGPAQREFLGESRAFLLWITGTPGSCAPDHNGLPAALSSELAGKGPLDLTAISSWPPRAAASRPRRTGSPAPLPDRSASATRSEKAPAPAYPRSAPATPPHHASRRDI